MPTNPPDEFWMKRAIHLAIRGRGLVEPNPMVGCVIVRNGEIIGEGFHRQFGGPHAEPNALAACTESPAGATAYVNLEPCCHQNKKTPPCVPALIAAKISRVVIGCLDPNPSVAGQGAAQLRSAGISVTTGLLEASAKQLNAAYFAGVLHKRPYVTLKWAESADGKVAGLGGRRTIISNAASRRVVHGLRARSDAILVGINTVIADDPLLTARHVATPRKLLRVVLDPRLRLSAESQLAKTAHLGPVIVYCTQRALQASGPMSQNVELVGSPAQSGRLALADVLADLHARSVTHLLVEPGPGLARAFFAENLANRVWRFRSPMRIEQPFAPAAEAVPYPAVAELNLDGDVLEEFLNPDSEAFFAAEPSADFEKAHG
jgi:diaminohydroxyphosphoribosylaminopyrimidine deaminase / 5-amino-6-(5-phosphoribosylamino)uracil reductase